MQRRHLLKLIPLSGLNALTLLCYPLTVFAAWSERAFRARRQVDSVRYLYGDLLPEKSTEIVIKLPEKIVDGSVVPISISSSLPQVERISLYIEGNQTPLAADFIIHPDTEPALSTRIRIPQKSRLTVLVKTETGLFSAMRNVEVRQIQQGS